MSGEPIDAWGVADTFAEAMMPPEHHGGVVRLTFITSRTERGARENFVVSRVVMTAEAYQAMRAAVADDRSTSRVEDITRAGCVGSC